jgi:hypothetical protein
VIAIQELRDDGQPAAHPHRALIGRGSSVLTIKLVDVFNRTGVPEG